MNKPIIEKPEIYLDNAATTKALEEVVKIVSRVMLVDYANPSSLHRKGMESEYYVKEARAVFAKLLKVLDKEIFFTSGGTESDNWAIIGAALANQRRGMHIITSKIEHPAVLEAFEVLAQKGFQVTYLDCDKQGLISMSQLRESLTDDTILVSMMAVNNEVGTIQPILEAGKIIKSYSKDILFHVDAVQGFAKVPIYPKQCEIDLLSVSAHKIHGPKGVGLLYIRDRVKIHPLIVGGGQQRGYRSGTDNVSGIAGFMVAAKSAYESMQDNSKRIQELKQYFVSELSKIEGVTLNGKLDEQGIAYIVSASFAGVKSEVLLHALEDQGIYVSSGSACASNKPSLSGTLRAMGVDKNLLDSTIRFSFSKFTTTQELDITICQLQSILSILRKYSKK